MSKKALTNGVSLKVENRSGFDKGFFNALTTGVGTLTPLVKQLLIPSSGKMKVKISAQLPPLASDAYLRSHLKVEAFAVPMRLCYGGFESWYCGREVYDQHAGVFLRAKLPFAALISNRNWRNVELSTQPSLGLGAGSLHDYFGVNFNYNADLDVYIRPSSEDERMVHVIDTDESIDGDIPYTPANIFPYVCYALIYDEWYRNKLVERPLFSSPAARSDQGMRLESQNLQAWNLPFVSLGERIGVVQDGDGRVEDETATSPDGGFIGDKLLNGRLFELRQRNYGDDYFTAATPSAQEGSPAFIDTSSGGFTIAALRLQNSLQEFKEANNYASPDYIQTNIVRYGVAPSMGVAQKPILLGSADFPMYTSGVEQTAEGTGQTTSNPFKSVGARYGSAHAEGSDFVCDFDVKEPSYLMVLVSLVPEATYSQGFDHDMQLFTQEGSLVDLPCAMFENIGNEAIDKNEINSFDHGVFGYVQRYLWHKLGNRNQCHGLFKADQSLGSFVVQRIFNLNGSGVAPSLNSSFLKVKVTDLDNVAAVSSGISKFGVMIDSRIDLYVSEPLSESSIPSLSDPAKEHGRSVYVKTGGSKLA